MIALLNPVNHKGERTKWGLVSYTVVMFSIVTAQIAIDLYTQSISYIDNRAFPGGDGAPPGPMGYQMFIYRKGLSTTSRVMYFLNAWLADGLLVSSFLDAVFTHPST